MTFRAYNASDDASMRSVVSEEKETALSSGAVKDSKSQALSALTEIESVAGIRKASAASTPSKKIRGVRIKAGNPTGTNCPSGKVGRSSVHSKPSEAKTEAQAEGVAHSKRNLALGSIAATEFAHELDDTPEFEGVGSAYDKTRLARRAYAKTKAVASARAPKNARKASSAAKGAGKGASGATKQSGGTQAAAAKVSQQGATHVSAAMTEKGTAKAIGAAASSAVAPVAGVLCGVIAFVLGVLVISQAISAIFGFWENEANKQAMEGLPPYITYEMVEAALECQEAYGHPAGCTIAQIIAESGQGDHLSQLATRDHNLFGIKWASSFAAAPEVTGKSSWRTGEVYDGESVTITAYFTVFKSDVDCIRFRSRVFLKQPHFANNASIQEAIANHDSDKMAEGLKEGGWATSPVYVETLKSIMDTYGLRRFDAMSVSDWKDMDAKAQKIVAAAESQLGVPYVWGGSTPGRALDCSGLTQYCYAQAGISIGHNTEVQSGQLRHVPISQAKPGDILYRSGHVAIYVGGDQYIHEPQTGDVCKRSSGISYFSYALTYRAS